MNSLKEKKFLATIENNRLIVKKVCYLYANGAEDKKDLEQEIYLQLWKSFSKFKGKSKVSTWMYKVALNTAITFSKKSEKKEKTENANIEFYDIAELDEGEREKQQEEMYMAIEKLSKVEKAFVMLYIDEKTYPEISEILGISEGNARIKLMRIKEKLKNTVTV